MQNLIIIIIIIIINIVRTVLTVNVIVIFKNKIKDKPKIFNAGVFCLRVDH